MAKCFISSDPNNIPASYYPHCTDEETEAGKGSVLVKKKPGKSGRYHQTSRFKASGLSLNNTASNHKANDSFWRRKVTSTSKSYTPEKRPEAGEG